MARRDLRLRVAHRHQRRVDRLRLRDSARLRLEQVRVALLRVRRRLRWRVGRHLRRHRLFPRHH